MFRTSVCALLALAVSSPALAQATQNANQIVGTVRFTNGPGAVLTHLQDVPADQHGMQIVRVNAQSNGVSPTESGSSATVRNASNGSATHIDYEVSLEGGGTPIHPQPIVYDVNAGTFGPTVTLDGTAFASRNTYAFLSQQAAPLSIEPAPDVQLDFEECVGLLDVSFTDNNNNPLPITSGQVQANIDLGSGYVGIQATGKVAAGQTNEVLAVHGGHPFQTTITYTYGTPFVDLTSHVCVVETFVGCDEIVPIDCQAPTGAGAGGNTTRIVGEVDMLGETELFNATTTPVQQSLTMMSAELGPNGNSRHALVAGSTPSEGPFVLPNIVGSATDGYRVSGQMLFGTGHDVQYFETPALSAQNGGEVVVAPGTTVDLDDTFVMDPGYLDGDLLFQGPPASESTCLDGLRRNSDQDSDGDGYPNDLRIQVGSHIRGVGRSTVAPGATYSASGGLTYGSFAGSYQPANGSFVGDYEMVLGGLEQQSSVWDLRRMDLDIGPTAMHLEDQLLTPDLQIDPGVSTTFDRHYCFGEISLAINSNSNLIFNPNVLGGGSFQGIDFEGNNADYSLSYLTSYGTPTSLANAAPGGTVTMCLPEGDYGFSPTVTTVDPSGGTSNTTLPPIAGVNVGCGQTKVVTLELQVDMEAPVCADAPEISIPWQATSIGGTPTNVQSVTGVLNNSINTPLCTNCGVDPSAPPLAPYTTALDHCENTVRIEAVDSQGNAASISQVVTYDGEAPTLTGCGDQVLTYDPDVDGALPTIQVAAGDVCDGSLPVSCTATFPDGTQSSVQPGDVFPLGASTVTCDATDGCDNVATCEFEVVVEEETSDCLLVDTLEASCNIGPNNVADGSYTVTLDTTVIDVQGAEQLLIPDPNVSPNVVDTQLASGQSAVIDLQLSNLDPGLTQYCFDVVTLNRNDDGELEECCLDEICVDLPSCDCMQPEAEAVCRPDGSMEVNLTVTNHSGDPIDNVFLDPVDPSHGLDTTWFDVSTMNPGDSLALAPVGITGATPGEEVCVRVTAHGADFEECCEDVVCFRTPSIDDCAVIAPASRGCSTGAAPLGGSLLLLGAGALIRRRR